jgi:acetyl-CoA synthetase
VVDDLVRNRAVDGAPDIITIGDQKIAAGEIEDVLEAHSGVAEAVCVPGPGGVRAFVVLEPGMRASDILEAELKSLIRREVGEAGTPQSVRFLAELPHSLSGQVARRILRKVAAGDLGNLGDPKTLANPGSLDELLKPAEA